jgi:hypothetical protein
MGKKKIIFENVSMPVENTFEMNLNLFSFNESLGLISKFISTYLLVLYFAVSIFACVLIFIHSLIWILVFLLFISLTVVKSIEEYKFYLVKKDFEENGIF